MDKLKEPTVIALFAEEFPNACAMIRITNPYRVMRDKGYAFDHARHVEMRELAQKGYPLGLYQVWVLPRLVDLGDGKALKLVEDLQKAGNVIVWETDDDYTEKHRTVLKHGADAMVVACACDAVTVSTPYLARIMADFHDQIYVLPNCVDLNQWKPAKDARQVQGLTIGIGGTPTHYEDWMVTLKPLQELLAEFPEVKLVVMGYKPDYYDLLPDEQVVFIEPVTYNQYPAVVRQVDIGLAPLESTVFNLCKSAIKVLEYWSSYRQLPGGAYGGAAAVATKMPVYEEVVEHKYNGLLVEHDEEAWYNAIRELIVNPKLRTRLGKRGLQYVREHRNINSQARLWLDAYNAILSGEGNHQSGSRKQKRKRQSR